MAGKWAETQNLKFVFARSREDGSKKRLERKSWLLRKMKMTGNEEKKFFLVGQIGFPLSFLV